jgi:cyclic dehypoxanthinyl futalosine synthase
VSYQTIEKKLNSGERISRAYAAWLFESGSNEQLKTLAQIVRSRFHPPDEATYLIMAIVNYTNVCVAKCDYCSFYRLPGQEGQYLLSFDEVCAKIDELTAHGGTLVGFNGGFHPDLTIHDYADLFTKIHARYPQLAFYEMTIAEFLFCCNVSRVSVEEGARILKSAGTRWVTGGGSEILDDAFRKRHSPSKYTVDEFYRAQRAILRSGMGSTATMVIGFDETLDERLNHLESLRGFQDEVDGALTSFLCWTYKPWNNELGGKEITTEEYLRWLAVSRIYLDNFVHIRTSVLTKNEEALLGLDYGANDFDLPTEDEVTQLAGATVSHEFEGVLNAGRELGYTISIARHFRCQRRNNNRDNLTIPTNILLPVEISLFPRP